MLPQEEGKNVFTWLSDLNYEGIIHGKKINTILVHADAFIFCMQRKTFMQTFRYTDFELAGVVREIFFSRLLNYKTIGKSGLEPGLFGIFHVVNETIHGIGACDAAG